MESETKFSGENYFRKNSTVYHDSQGMAFNVRCVCSDNYMLHTRDSKKYATVTLIIISEFRWMKNLSTYFMIPSTSSRTWGITCSFQISSYSHHSLQKNFPPTSNLLGVKDLRVYFTEFMKKDSKCKANLRAVPKLTNEVIEPVKVKRSANSVALLQIVPFSPSPRFCQFSGIIPDLVDNYQFKGAF